MQLPAPLNMIFRNRRPERSLVQIITLKSTLIGTGGVAPTTGTTNIPVPIPRLRFTVGAVQVNVQSGAVATAYTLQLFRRRVSDGTDIALSQALSVRTADIVGAQPRAVPFVLAANVTDSQRTLEPGDTLYVAIAVNTVTTQPVCAVCAEGYVRE